MSADSVDWLDAVARIADPVERALAAAVVLGDLASRTALASRVRDDAVRELRRAGWSQRKVADALGLSYGRVQQLEK